MHKIQINDAADDRIVDGELVSAETVREARAKAAKAELLEIETDENRRIEVACDDELYRIMKIEANIAATKPKLHAAKDRARRELRKKYGTGDTESRIDLSEVRAAFGTRFGRLALGMLVVGLLLTGVRAIAPTEAATAEEPHPTSSVRTETVQDPQAELPADTGKSEVSQNLPPERTASLDRQGEAAAAFLGRRAPHLVGCVGQLVSGEHPRWVEAIGIAGAETSFGTTGVALTDNNMGGIKSSRPDRKWRRYANRCDGLEDIAYLIESDRYAGLTIDEMNGTYCVNEAAGSGRCPNWAENVMRTVVELRSTLM